MAMTGQISAQVPASLRGEIDELAATLGIPVAAVIRGALRAGLATVATWGEGDALLAVPRQRA